MKNSQGLSTLSLFHKNIETKQCKVFCQILSWTKNTSHEYFCCLYLTDSPSFGWLGVLNEFLVPKWSCPSLLKQKSCSPSGTTNLANQNRISRLLADRAGKAEVEFTWPLLFFSSFEKRSVSLCIPDRPGTHQSVCLCLPSAGMKDEHPHTRYFYFQQTHSRGLLYQSSQVPFKRGRKKAHVPGPGEEGVL